MQLIVIGGQAGVGKTTLAHMIAKKAFELGFIPVVESFAGALKREAEEEGYNKEDFPEEYRKFCQELGAKKRQEDPNYWINKFNTAIEDILKKEEEDLEKNSKYWERCVIVDDCRYPNEVSYSLEKQASTIFMTYGRRRNPNSRKSWFNHESEDLANSVAKNPEKFSKAFAYFIENDQSISELTRKAELGTPYWCNVCADKNTGLRMKELSKCISDLIDLLLLNALERDYDDEETE